MVILSGPPGAGKTTVARAMASAWGLPAVHLKFDDFLMAIQSGFIAPWLADSHAQNTTVTQAFATAGAIYAKAGYAVVLDGVVGPGFLAIYREAAAEAQAELHYAILRPDRGTAVARARDRDAEPMPDYPPGLFERFVDVGPFAGHVIDTDSIPVEAVVAAVRKGLEAGRFRVSLTETPPPSPV